MEDIVSVVLAWTPMLVFLVLWFWLMRRQSSNKTPYGRFLDRSSKYYDAHIEMLKAQNEKLDKLIAVLEKRS